jgi:hypothetical protein
VKESLITISFAIQAYTDLNPEKGEEVFSNPAFSQEA